MEKKSFNRNWFSSVILYSMIVWTIICFIGTWVIILKYGILLQGLIAIVTTFFFAATIWVVPLMGLILLSFYVDPPEEPPPYVTYKELIKRGMRKSSE